MSLKNLRTYMVRLREHLLLGWPSLIAIFVLGLSSIVISTEYALFLGPILAPLGFNVGMSFIAAAAAMTLMLLVDPKKNDQEMLAEVKKGNVAEILIK